MVLTSCERFERVMFAFARWCNLIQRWLKQATCSVRWHSRLCNDGCIYLSVD